MLLFRKQNVKNTNLDATRVLSDRQSGELSKSQTRPGLLRSLNQSGKMVVLHKFDVTHVFIQFKVTHHRYHQPYHLHLPLLLLRRLSIRDYDQRYRLVDRSKIQM